MITLKIQLGLLTMKSEFYILQYIPSHRMGNICCIHGSYLAYIQQLDAFPKKQDIHTLLDYALNNKLTELVIGHDALNY